MLLNENTFKFLKNTIKKHGSLEIPSSGYSMYPFIQQQDICKFTPCKPSLLKKGDVILYYSPLGKLIVHRFVKKKTIKGHRLYFCKGDTNPGLDQPIKEEQIIGKLTRVEKRHLKISTEKIIPCLWGKMILMFPFISKFLRKYLNWKAKFQIIKE